MPSFEFKYGGGSPQDDATHVFRFIRPSRQFQHVDIGCEDATAPLPRTEICAPEDCKMATTQLPAPATRMGGSGAGNEELR